MPGHDASEARRGGLRSMGVEFPVNGDPVKLHGLVHPAGWSFWRCECMACGYRSPEYKTPGQARQACKTHATGVRHRRNVRWAEVQRSEALR